MTRPHYKKLYLHEKEISAGLRQRVETLEEQIRADAGKPFFWLIWERLTRFWGGGG